MHLHDHARRQIEMISICLRSHSLHKLRGTEPCRTDSSAFRSLEVLAERRDSPCLNEWGIALSAAIVRCWAFLKASFAALRGSCMLCTNFGCWLLATGTGCWPQELHLKANAYIYTVTTQPSYSSPIDIYSYPVPEQLEPFLSIPIHCKQEGNWLEIVLHDSYGW